MEIVSHYWGQYAHPVHVALIARLIVGYEFDVGKFLAREIWDRAVGGEKLLLVYPCMITWIFLDVGVYELPWIDQLIDPKNVQM